MLRRLGLRKKGEREPQGGGRAEIAAGSILQKPSRLLPYGVGPLAPLQLSPSLRLHGPGGVMGVAYPLMRDALSIREEGRGRAGPGRRISGYRLLMSEATNLGGSVLGPMAGWVRDE